MKKKGVPIIHRLDGLNWLHRVQRRNWKNWLLNEIRNLFIRTIRNTFADAVVYQSKFVENWWKNHGTYKGRSYIINNGVNLKEFKPSKKIDKNQITLMCLEGYLDYSPYAIDLMNKLNLKIQEKQISPPLIVYGDIKYEISKRNFSSLIDYRGIVSRDELSSVYHNVIYFSLDVNAACPNTVIEALASGIPVVGFDTGALKELVSSKAGEIVPYGSNPWELAFPDIEALIKGIQIVKNNYISYAKEARKLAEDKYDIKTIMDQYLKVINLEIKRVNQYKTL